MRQKVRRHITADNRRESRYVARQGVLLGVALHTHYLYQLKFLRYLHNTCSYIVCYI